MGYAGYVMEVIYIVKVQTEKDMVNVVNMVLVEVKVVILQFHMAEVMVVDTHMI